MNTAERGRASDPLWTFSVKDFTTLFSEGLEELGLDTSTIPYQVRHGAASLAAVEGEDLASIQRRLRHVNPASTRRYERHTRYLAEVNALPPAVVNYGDFIEERIVPFLLKKRLCPNFEAFCKQTRA